MGYIFKNSKFSCYTWPLVGLEMFMIAEELKFVLFSEGVWKACQGAENF